MDINLYQRTNGRAEQPVPSSQSTSQRLSKQPNFYNYDLHDCQPGGFHTEIHMKRRRAPFVVQGVHSDNGSEYINRKVAKLLEKLRIEFTKSRPRHSNDNALAESKNGAVVRKLFGYEHIPQRWAPQINAFNHEYLNPYLNYHRPCFFQQQPRMPRASSARPMPTPI